MKNIPTNYLIAGGIVVGVGAFLWLTYKAGKNIAGAVNAPINKVEGFFADIASIPTSIGEKVTSFFQGVTNGDLTPDFASYFEGDNEANGIAPSAQEIANQQATISAAVNGNELAQAALLTYGGNVDPKNWNNP